MASLLGSQLKNLDRGLRLARGWDGDRAALYEGTRGARLLVWASSWDSPSAARRFAGAWAEERRQLHRATLTRRADRRLAWTRPDGGAGILRCEGKRLLILESGQSGALVEAEAGPAPATPSPPNPNPNPNPNPLEEAEAGPAPATFTEPPQDAPRAAANPAFLRLNPLFSSRQGRRLFGHQITLRPARTPRRKQCRPSRPVPPGPPRPMAPHSFLHPMEARLGPGCQTPVRGPARDHQDHAAALGPPREPFLDSLAPDSHQCALSRHPPLGAGCQRDLGGTRQTGLAHPPRRPLVPKHLRSRQKRPPRPGHRQLCALPPPPASASSASPSGPPKPGQGGPQNTAKRPLIRRSPKRPANGKLCRNPLSEPFVGNPISAD